MPDKEQTRIVRVNRTVEIEQLRSKLPAVLTEQEIVDAVRSNDFSIICGDTGCGKSTQVPQFIYEAGFTEGENSGMIIGVTQPRRVAAIAVAERVGVELNKPDLVGYQVRYDKKMKSESMRLKFMTDGILLREIQEDIRLPRYSVIVIDEAHERSINCDMLLGLLSGSIRARKASGKPLKVVIMSATLRMTDFTENKYLFPNPSKSSPAVVQIDNRMHSVVVHYERRTEEDYVSLSVDKIKKIHKTLPPGAILVFVTGKAEVHKVCNAFRRSEVDEDDMESVAGSEDEMKESGSTVAEEGFVFEDLKRVRIDDSVTEEIDFNLGVDNGFTEELSFSNGKMSSKPKQSKAPKSAPAAVTKSGEVITPFTGGGSEGKLRVFPLYAQMSTDRQMRVFNANKEYPDDRIVVVSTNVAETSLTIPNIRYVIDSGKEKRKEFNSNGVSRFAVRFTSKASANQRAGRAGRVGPGHVYRLYSPNVFGEHMAEFASAEIETNPLDASVLFLKSMGVRSFLNFPWPSPPPQLHVEAAMKRLRAIGALSRDGKVSETGKQVGKYPIAPRLAVALLKAIERVKQDETIKEIVSVFMVVLVSMLSVDCLVSPDATTEAETAKAIEISNHDYADDLDMMVSKFVACNSILRKDDRDKFCSLNGLNPKAIDEAKSLSIQLARTLLPNREWNELFALMAKFTKPALDRQILRVVRESCTNGFVDQIAIREEAGAKTYRAPGCSDPVHIHRSSVMYRLRPQFLAFGEMQQASGQFGNNKRSMRICFPVDPEYLATVDSPLIDKTKPHAMLKPSVVGGRKMAWVVPRYTPLSVTITDCVKVDLGRA